MPRVHKAPDAAWARPTEETTVLDFSIAELTEIARRGGEDVCRELHEAGLPLVGIEEDWVVKVWPDGRREKVERVRN